MSILNARRKIVSFPTKMPFFSESVEMIELKPVLEYVRVLQEKNIAWQTGCETYLDKIQQLNLQLYTERDVYHQEVARLMGELVDKKKMVEELLDELQVHNGNAYCQCWTDDGDNVIQKAKDMLGIKDENN